MGLGQRYHDGHGQLALKQLRLSVPNEMHMCKALDYIIYEAACNGHF